MGKSFERASEAFRLSRGDSDCLHVLSLRHVGRFFQTPFIQPAVDGPGPRPNYAPINLSIFWLAIARKGSNLKSMKHSASTCNRRAFLRWGATMAAGAPLAFSYARQALAAALATQAPGVVPAAML